MHDTGPPPPLWLVLVLANDELSLAAEGIGTQGAVSMRDRAATTNKRPFINKKKRPFVTLSHIGLA